MITTAHSCCRHAMPLPLLLAVSVVVSLTTVCLPVYGFLPLYTQPPRTSARATPTTTVDINHRPTSATAVTTALGSNPNDYDDSNVEDWTDDRKANLFQYLLRDLEVEGTPLLGCDADQVHTFLAALFTTMAELGQNNNSDKVCLVLEAIPVDALRSFVDDFIVLKTQTRLVSELPELERFSISLVGKGVGPALVIETEPRTAEQASQYDQQHMTVASSSSFDDLQSQWTTAQQAFVKRMMEGLCIPPHQPGALPFVTIVAYRFAESSEVCNVLAGFWNGICELQAVSDQQIGSLMLSYPPLPSSISDGAALQRYAAVAEVISRTLCLYRGDDVFELLHVNPVYSREDIYPSDKPAHGHLPPTSWLRSMMEINGNMEEAESMTDQQLSLQNYQRRSPLPGVLIDRVPLLEAVTPPEDQIVQISVEDRPQLASGCRTYSRSVITLAAEGEEMLQEALAKEIELVA